MIRSTPVCDLKIYARLLRMHTKNTTQQAPCVGKPDARPGTVRAVKIRQSSASRAGLYDLYYPPGYDPAVRSPLVVAFHGFDSGARNNIASSARHS